MHNNANVIGEEERVKYRVVVEGQTLTETASKPSAENFVSTLSPEQQKKAQIVPITESGHQLLLG